MRVFLCVYVYVYVYNRFLPPLLVRYCFFEMHPDVPEYRKAPARKPVLFPFFIGIRKNAKKAFAGDLLHKRQIARFLLQIRQTEPDLFLDFMF